ncbi:hypothetical protein GUITHDRAFT_166857 [Guillardia theta CCMP2712]|uniref:SAM domain-containing protein n=1 Tax=Guillardia theta (strain CCMP2712) TaxID=905079 RepID=L1I684_GUITC|nr:hypothetical protein GUITHDRAFT_166857 [Guillardia theta CCMP2712]EKX31607.1 hypothetical protein GUITHDRAFT_166857 [Guillardia theta CCMP2712]|eukprot:XP_005818587.1 hypothetical protein GUITHDRAFT_166857 [Guillardia theta CCMP2712]
MFSRFFCKLQALCCLAFVSGTIAFAPTAPWKPAIKTTLRNMPGGRRYARLLELFCRSDSFIRPCPLRSLHPRAARMSRTSFGLFASAQKQEVVVWTKEDVVEWLKSEGFNEEWTNAFLQNDIDGEALSLLKDPMMLDSMSIPKPVGQRLKFWQRLDVLLQGSAGQQKAVEPAAPAPVSESRTKTMMREMSFEDAVRFAGSSTAAPLQGDKVDALVRDETAFIESMCELLAELDAKDRDITLLLDMKDRLVLLFSVVVVGEFNAGKSSLINAILGSKFCEEGVVPTTTTINMLRYGTGEESGKKQRNKDYQELFLPVELLRQVTLVDTPGTNAIIKEQTRLTKGFIPQSDLIIFVTSAERPITETEGKLLEYIREWGKKVVMVLNKVDLFDSEENLEKVKQFVRENAARILGVEPPVFGIAGRLALQSKLMQADKSADPKAAEDLWKESRFEELESYVVRTLTDKKEAAKLKLESPLGVAERFLVNYKKASELGNQITEDDKQVLNQIKQSIEVYEAEIESEMNFQLKRLDSILNSVQQRAKTTTSKVLSGTYIASNIVGCLTKSKSIEGELEAAMDVDLDKEVKELAEDFGRILRDKQEAQWNLCSALIDQRLRSRQWKQISLQKPDTSLALRSMQETLESPSAGISAQFDPRIERMVLGQSVTQKAFDVAVATASVAGGGLLALEVFNAGLLDALAFLTTGGGLAYSLGVYPSILQDEVADDLDSRSAKWKAAVKEDVEKLFQQAARTSAFEIEQAFAPYVDAVSVEAERWTKVKQRVDANLRELSELRGRLKSL